MIKVALGTEKFPFVRLMEWLDQAIDDGFLPKDEEIKVQSGTTIYTPRHKNIVMTPTVPYQQQMEEFRDARMSIIHAGMGNLLDMADINEVPIMIPRDPTLGEHVDSHQLDFCKVAEKELHLPIVYTYEQFTDAIKHYDDSRTFPSYKKELVDYLVSVVES